ncbi:MAG: protein-(glutamine-N5) methyltransferase, release factor-specific [Elusimicrobia bacterium RIFCSPHIGHO2_01_FULL_64_10]|nr:MAG: protein-(glutamine-N5) methyltransferase, release factor-specific [Elusimicrobia bacterium RIFCSPHIGHO2_01_FULL_64_10]
MRWGESRLRRAGIRNAFMESAWLLAARTSAGNAGDLILRRSEKISAPARRDYRADVSRRGLRVPLAYILGSQEFMGLEFRADPRALIPRPETEVLARAAIEFVASRAGRARMIDIGTGTGVLAVVLAARFPGVLAAATDVSGRAIALARANAARFGLAGRIRFSRGELFARARGRFDLIVSNPPYVRSGDIAGLQKEVRREPRAALDGGPDGLGVIRPLVQGSVRRLRPGGGLLLEVGDGQARGVARLFRKAGLAGIRISRDDSGIDRVVAGSAPW